MAALYRFIYSKWYPPAPPSTSFAGKTVLVTGANTGLGFEAAKHYLNLDAAHLIIAVRSLDKGSAAKARLEQAYPNKKDVIDVLPLDMNSYKSIKEFVDTISTKYDDLHVALLNAGISNRLYSISPEGWEETLQVNTLSTTLLALLLLPKLRASRRNQDDVHMVIVSSGLHAGVTAKEIDASSENILAACNDSEARFAAGSGVRQYAISKLLVMFVVKELAALGTTAGGEPAVLVTTCCPGACITDLGRQYNRWYEQLAMRLLGPLIARTVEEGSRTLVSAAGLGAESQGGYWKNDQLMP